MNTLRCTISYNREVIGYCGFTNLLTINNTNIFKFEFIEYTSKQNRLIEEGDDLYVSIGILNVKGEEVPLIELKIIPIEDTSLNNGKDIIITGHVISKYKTDVYDQSIIDLLIMLKDDKLKWSSLKKSHKSKYLNVIFKVYGRIEKFNTHNIFVNCFNIRDEDDFYYELNKAVAGERKYFASNLSSLEDILIDLAIISKKKVTIVFNDISNVKRVIGTTYFNEFFKILSKANIEIKESGVPPRE
ncbi:MAG: barstar family protein [Aureispira sp.]